jgi:hypothetical protein
MTETKAPTWLEIAESMGREAGTTAGSWTLDGNTSTETARQFVQWDEDGDPQLWDHIPSAPFSGEWAGSPTPAEIVYEVTGEELDDLSSALDWILDVYEQAYNDAAHAEVMRMAYFYAETESA